MAMVLLANVTKSTPLNSAYIISAQHDAKQVTQTLSLSSEKYSNLPYRKVGKNQLWSKL